MCDIGRLRSGGERHSRSRDRTATGCPRRRAGAAGGDRHGAISARSPALRWRHAPRCAYHSLASRRGKCTVSEQRCSLLLPDAVAISSSIGGTLKNLLACSRRRRARRRIRVDGAAGPDRRRRPRADGRQHRQGLRDLRGQGRQGRGDRARFAASRPARTGSTSTRRATAARRTARARAVISIRTASRTAIRRLPSTTPATCRLLDADAAGNATLTVRARRRDDRLRCRRHRRPQRHRPQGRRRLQDAADRQLRCARRVRRHPQVVSGRSTKRACGGRGMMPLRALRSPRCDRVLVACRRALRLRNGGDDHAKIFSRGPGLGGKISGAGRQLREGLHRGRRVAKAVRR